MIAKCLINSSTLQNGVSVSTYTHTHTFTCPCGTMNSPGHGLSRTITTSLKPLAPNLNVCCLLHKNFLLSSFLPVQIRRSALQGSPLRVQEGRGSLPGRRLFLSRSFFPDCGCVGVLVLAAGDRRVRFLPEQIPEEQQRAPGGQSAQALSTETHLKCCLTKFSSLRHVTFFLSFYGACRIFWSRSFSPSCGWSAVVAGPKLSPTSSPPQTPQTSSCSSQPAELQRTDARRPRSPAGLV